MWRQQKQIQIDDVKLFPRTQNPEPRTQNPEPRYEKGPVVRASFVFIADFWLYAYALGETACAVNLLLQVVRVLRQECCNTFW